MRSVSSEHTYRVGERALYPFGAGDTEVEVIEDPLGGLDSRFVRIRLPITESDPIEMTIAASRLRPVASAD